MQPSFNIWAILVNFKLKFFSSVIGNRELIFEEGGA